MPSIEFIASTGRPQVVQTATPLPVTQTGNASVAGAGAHAAAIAGNPVRTAGRAIATMLPTGMPLTANTILNVQLSVAGTIRLNVLGYTAP